MTPDPQHWDTIATDQNPKQVWEYSKEELAEKYAVALCEIDRLRKQIASLQTTLQGGP